MNGSEEGLLRRLWHRVFPRVPDFTGLVAAQASLLEETLDELAAFLAREEQDRATEVRACVDQAHAQAQAHLDLLHRSFITRIDREDIYVLITRVDHIFDYATTSVREIELLELAADQWMTAMVERLREGTSALTAGLACFRERPEDSEPHAARTRQAEREVEELYRQALAELFAEDAYRPGEGEESTAACVAFMLDRMKRREVYRHLSNAADRLAHAGEALHDMSVKYA